MECSTCYLLYFPSQICFCRYASVCIGMPPAPPHTSSTPLAPPVSSCVSTVLRSPRATPVPRTSSARRSWPLCVCASELCVPRAEGRQMVEKSLVPFTDGWEGGGRSERGVTSAENGLARDWRRQTHCPISEVHRTLNFTNLDEQCWRNAFWQQTRPDYVFMHN